MVTTRLDVARAHRRGPAGRASCCGAARTRTRSRRSSTSTRATTRPLRVRRDARRRAGHPGRARRSPASAREAYLRVRADGAGTLHRRGLGRRRGVAADRRSRSTDLGDPDDAEDRPQGRPTASDSDERGAVPVLPRRLLGPRRAGVRRRPSSPAQPDGELGWYTTAADGHARRPTTGRSAASARSSTGSTAGRTQTYSGPFTIGEPGEHEVEYFATDDAAEPNVEAREDARPARRRATAPEDRSPSLARPGGRRRPGRGDARSAGRRGGSGAVLTQYRVDGGPWQTYSGRGRAAASTAPRRRSRSGRRPAPAAFELLDDGSGGITPVGGLGMLWYPVKPFGDFKLKFQFREGRTDGGLLQRRRVRALPGPARAGRPASGRLREDRHRGDRPGVGGDLLRPRDPALRRHGPASRRRPGRSTTSTRTASTTIGEPSEVGEWNDYEVEVVGQTLPIFRNGDADQRVRERARDRVVARRRPADDAAPVRAGLHRPAEPRRPGPHAVPRRPGRGPLGGRARAQPDRARSR